MRIAFFAPMKAPDHPVPSGDRRMARLLLQAMAYAGHDVAVESAHRLHEPKGDPAAQRALMAAADAETAGLLADYRSGARRRPDVWFTYHSYYKAPDAIGPRIADALSVPYAVAEASYATSRANGPWSRFHDVAVTAIRRADVHFCLTAHDREMLARIVPPGRLIDLRPFLDLAPFTGLAPKSTLRARLAGAATFGGPLILAVGMFRRRDKLDSYRLLGEALARIGDLDWRLVVVGGGEAEAEVRAACAPFAARVIWLGQQAPEDLPAIYGACDLYAWPAVNEAYGMAFLEAQAAGLPVVAGRLRGVPDVVRENESALLTPPGAAQPFADAVRTLLVDAARREGMAAAARAFVRGERGLEHAAALLDGGLRMACGR